MGRRKPENVKPNNSLSTPQSTWENEAGSTLWPPLFSEPEQQTNLVRDFNFLNLTFSKRINKIKTSDRKNEEP